MIKWRGKSTNGIWRRKEEADTFTELYELCVMNETINTTDSDPWGDLILEESNKSYSDFKDEDGDIDYDAANNFIYSDKSYSPTDEDIWLLIANQNGNAYYQTFEYEDEDGELIAIDKDCFDEDGKFKY